MEWTGHNVWRCAAWRYEGIGTALSGWGVDLGLAWTHSPTMPRTYEQVFSVRDEHIDDLGHVNNLVYLEWVQAVAGAHWAAAARPEDQAETTWVVVRQEIDYLKPAHPGDEVVARTWVERWKGATSHRHTELRRAADGQVLARSRTVWGALDAESGRPRRIPSSMRDPFLEDHERVR